MTKSTSRSRVTVSASASSGNLGPGFDYLGLALALRTTATVENADQWEVTSGDPSGIVQTAAARVTDQPLRIHLTSDIPMGKGLGSSAACIASTIGAAQLIMGQSLDRRNVIDAGYELEGHYDNLAAATFGGLVICSPQGYVEQLALHQSIRVLVALPDETLPTQQARLALPGDVPLGAAARTASRTFFLIEGLRTGNVDLLREVGQDELHEPHRIRLRPIIGTISGAARAAGAAASAMSGAGPSVLAFTTDEHLEQVSDAMRKALGGSGEVRQIEIGDGLREENA